MTNPDNSASKPFLHIFSSVRIYKQQMQLYYLFEWLIVTDLHDQ